MSGQNAYDRAGPEAQAQYDFLSSAIEFTRICSVRCNVLRGDDDRLSSKEENCISNSTI